MLTKMCGDTQNMLLAIIGLTAALPLRATSKTLKKEIEDQINTLRTGKGKWNARQLRAQIPWNYLRPTPPSYPMGPAPMGLIRQNADHTELTNIMLKLQKWGIIYHGVVEAGRTSLTGADYLWATDRYHPKKSEMEHREARYIVFNEAADLARHERVFKCI